MLVEPMLSTLLKRHDSIFVRSAVDLAVDGQRARIKAATPATCGDAIEVPPFDTQKLFAAHGKDGAATVPKFICREQTEKISPWAGHAVNSRLPPGAEMSTLGTEPRFE